MTDRCTCCKREWPMIVLPSGRTADGRGRRDDGICPDCWEHAPFAQQRDAEHLAWWQAQFDQSRTEAAASKATLEGRLDALQAHLESEMRNRPERIVEKWINREVIDAAEAKAESAYRSRERAWQGLCELRLLHREGTGGRCRCGARRDQCAEAEILDAYPGIVRWEAEQIARLRRHQPHALPPNHPVVLDPRLLATWDDGAMGDFHSDTA
jgi:hypothetical protein